MIYCSRHERSNSECSISVFDTIDSLIEAKFQAFIIDDKLKVSKKKSEVKNKKYRKKETSSSINPKTTTSSASSVTYNPNSPGVISSTDINQTCKLNDLIIRY